MNRPPPENQAPRVSTRGLWQLTALDIFHGLLRWTYSLAVFGGCTYLVFWRHESGWLFVPACVLMLFRRGL